MNVLCSCGGRTGCIQRFCDSIPLVQARTDDVLAVADCIEDVRQALPSEVEELTAQWKMLVRAKFRKAVAALNEPGAVLPGAAAPAAAAAAPVPAAAPPPPEPSDDDDNDEDDDDDEAPAAEAPESDSDDERPTGPDGDILGTDLHRHLRTTDSSEPHEPSHKRVEGGAEASSSVTR